MNGLNIPPPGMLPPSGLPDVGQSRSASQPSVGRDGKTFNDILAERVAENNLKIHFSAHAKQRMEMRKVELNPDKLQRLDQAIDIAKNKGSHDSLILMDGDAYVVNVDKRTVITAVQNTGEQGGVFTKIDSTVIV